MVGLALGIMPDFQISQNTGDHRTTQSRETAQVVILLIDQVGLIEDLSRFYEADTVFPLDFCVFPQSRSGLQRLGSPQN